MFRQIFICNIDKIILNFKLNLNGSYEHESREIVIIVLVDLYYIILINKKNKLLISI